VLRQKTRTSRLYVPIVCLFLGLAVAVRAADPFFVQALRLIAFDSYQQLSPRAYDADLPVRVVDIDPDSIARFGQWPWPRTMLRDLVLKLEERHAAAIAFDILFAEADRTSFEEVRKQLPPEAANRLEESVNWPTNDEQFADALRQAPCILSTILVDRPTARSPIRKAGIVFAGDDPKAFLRGFEGADINLPMFENAAAGIGSMNLVPNHDGVVRQVPLFFRLGDQLFPSLAAEALRVAQGASTYVLKSSNASGETAFGQKAGLNHVRIGSIDVATDEAGALAVKFRYSNPLAFLPAWKVLSGEADERDIAGRIILIGSSAPGLLDLRSSPLETAIAGVEIQAQTLENMLSGEQLRRPDFALAFEMCLMSALALIMAITTPRIAPPASAAAATALLATLYFSGWLAFRHLGLLFDPVYPSLILLLLTAAITFYVYRQVETQRSEIRSAFSRYLAPEVVEEIIARPEKLTLGGEVRELTLMFCDVRDFTAISEGFTASELTSFLNNLMTPLSEIILSERGTIDKYMGDAIMAFWNAPLDIGDHAARACRAAIAMLGELDELNRQWEEAARGTARAFVPVKIGIGINTGSCCVGNLGSKQRFDYSAIGDEVNVTARIESLTKLYGVAVVVGEHTAERLPEAEVLELDFIKVKGRSKPTRLFGLVKIFGADPMEFSKLRVAHASFLSAYRKRNWDEAQMLIGRCRKANIRQLITYYDVFETRIGVLRKAAFDSDWDGAFTITTK